MANDRGSMVSLSGRNYNRYYKKKDLDLKKMNIKPSDAEFIGENELFITNHTDKIYIDSINGRCKVRSFHLSASFTTSRNTMISQ
jgi:hypothetical protein